LVANESGGVEAREVYFLDGKTFQNHHGGMIMLGDYIYAGHGHNRGAPICLEWKTGKVAWRHNRGPGTGSAAVAYADGNLYYRFQNGVMALIEATPSEYLEKGTFQIPQVEHPSWSHPVIAGGKLYLREQDALYCSSAPQPSNRDERANAMKPLRFVLSAVCCSIVASLATADELGGLLIDGQDWQLVSEGYTFTEGPAVDLQGNLYFTDTFRSKIYRINEEGQAEVFVDQSYGTNGLMFGPDGRLYGCQNAKKRIVAYDSSGTAETIAEDVQSNDIVVNRDGGIYFTDPPHKQVWYIPPGGEKRVVDTGLGYANGLILSPDQGTLVVADMRGTNLWAYRIGEEGDLTDKQPFYTLRIPDGRKDSGADGMTIDSEGRIYCTSHLGLQVFDTQGRLIGIIDKPQKSWLANAVFAGPKLDTLYVTCMDKVYKRKINAQGIRYFDVAGDK